MWKRLERSYGSGNCSRVLLILNHDIFGAIENRQYVVLSNINSTIFQYRLY